MSIPASLTASLHDPVFWARYLFAHEGWPGSERLGDLADVIDEQDDLADEGDEGDDGDEGDQGDDGLEPELVVVFDVGGGHRLVLELSPVLGSHSLGILGPGEAEAVELGWDDCAHWHPYALRWSELELVCRALAARDAELPHPGHALALLCRFAAVFEDDDVDDAVAMVEAAFASLRPDGWTGYWPSGADWLDRSDFRGQNVTWHRDEAGYRWAAQGLNEKRDFYSTRITPPGTDQGFPHERLHALLAAAQATTVAR